MAHHVPKSSPFTTTPPPTQQFTKLQPLSPTKPPMKTGSGTPAPQATHSNKKRVDLSPHTTLVDKLRNLIVGILLRVLRIFTAPIRYGFRAFLLIAEFFGSIMRDVCAQLLQPFNSLARFVGSFIVKVLKVMIIVTIYTSIALTVAVCIYLLSYWAFIPSVHAERPLYFDYRNPSGMPQAYVQIAGDKDGFVPSNRFAYEVSIELVVPESVENLNAGMFMVTTSLYSNDGSPLFSSSRPCLLHYKSELLRTMYTFFFGLPMILGFMEETQTLSFSPIDGWQNTGSESLSYATVTLSKSDIQIYSARVAIRARLTGFSYYAYHWSITTFFVGVSIIFMMETIFAIAIALFIYLRPPIEDGVENAYYDAESPNTRGDAKKAMKGFSSHRATFVPIYQPAIPAEHRHLSDEDRYQREEGEGASGIWDMDKLRKVSEKDVQRKRVDHDDERVSATVSPRTGPYGEDTSTPLVMAADDEVDVSPSTTTKTVITQSQKKNDKKQKKKRQQQKKRNRREPGAGVGLSETDSESDVDIETVSPSVEERSVAPSSPASSSLEEGWETVPDNTVERDDDDANEEEQVVVLTEPIDLPPHEHKDPLLKKTD